MQLAIQSVKGGLRVRLSLITAPFAYLTVRQYEL
jgi:hypothetical protein